MNEPPVISPAAGGIDLRAEAWAALIAAEGRIASENILIRSLGEHGRTYRNDVVNAEFAFDERIQERLLFLDVRRDGIYDGLPEALFHEAGSGRSIKGNATEDGNALKARQFFQPFEQELFRLRTELLTTQLGHALGRKEDPLRTWEEMWDIPRDLDERTREALLVVLPHTRDAIGDLELTTACFTFVLGHPVAITTDGTRVTTIENGARSDLGSSSLGSIILGGILREQWPHVSIVVGEIPIKRLVDQNQRSGLLRTVGTLIAYFLPAHLGTSVELRVAEEDQEPSLGSVDRPTLLGLNSRLAMRC